MSTSLSLHSFSRFLIVVVVFFIFGTFFFHLDQTRQDCGKMKSLQDLKCGFLLASGSPCWENVTITDLLVKRLLDSPQQEDSLNEYNIYFML